jgi:hypothetical protein
LRALSIAELRQQSHYLRAYGGALPNARISIAEIA